jgi:hypothetical protein
MKKIFLISALCVYIFSCKKSAVTPIIPVPKGANIYVAGFENKVAKYWKNGLPVVVSDSVNRTNALANCIVVSGNDVYVGGYESETATPNLIAKYWKNGKGVNLTVPSAANAPEITSMAVSGNDVYAAGYERNANSIEVAKYWKNGMAVSLTGSTTTSRNARINGIAVVGNDVYAAGYEFVLRVDAGTTYGVLVAKYWKNGVDMLLGGTDGFAPSYASSIFVAGADVYVAGYGKSPDLNGYQTAKYWKNGTEISLLKASATSYESAANSIAIIGNDVYVAGYETINSIKVAKYWKNGTAVVLTDDTKDAVANSIFIAGTDVYCAGYELDKTFNYVAKYWKNGKEVVLTDGSKPAFATSIVIAN